MNQFNDDTQLTREDYISLNKSLFYERGAIQWKLHQLTHRPLSSLPKATRTKLARLYAERAELVLESLQRFDDPTDQIAAFHAAREAVAGIPDVIDDDRAAARAWFDTSKYERICARAGKVEAVAARFADVQARIDAIVNYTEDDPAPFIERRVKIRLDRALDEVTTQITRINSRLTKSYVKSFTRSAGRHDAEDYEASGMVGLVRAITTFDPDAGRFDTWAYKHIQREVLHMFRSAEYASMNHSDFERRPRVMRAVAALQARDGDRGHNPSYEEVAREAGLTVEQVKRVLDAPRVDSLSVRIGEDGDTELGDMIEQPDSNVEGAVVTQMTLSAVERYGLSVLDPRELLVITRRLGLDDEPQQRLAAIGQMLGRSREGIRQAEARAIAKLKHPVVLRRVLREGRP